MNLPENPSNAGSDFLQNALTNQGSGLAELSRQSPLLVVFLRHSGCPFCREALADIAEHRREIEEGGTRVVLVHMSTDKQAESFFAQYHLDDLPRISDPECSLYRQFGLVRGTHAQVAGLKIWWRGFQATILKRHGVGRIIGDVLQMPGAFLVVDGEIVRTFRPENSAERPDYAEMARCELGE